MTPVGRAVRLPGRPWLAAVLVLLLVVLFLVGEFTYARAHLPPNRYDPQPAGAAVRLGDGDFRVVSMRQTEGWGRESDGSPVSPDPGAVWVVVQLEVTPGVKDDFFPVELTLVATDGSEWEPETLGPTHEGESYLSDDYVAGRTYTIVQGYQVPAAAVDRIAGLTRSRYDGRAWPLLRPAS